MKIICTITKTYDSVDYPELTEESATDQFIDDVANSNFEIETEVEE